MATILCLAHYCDTHGPTPLMVTEGLLVDCQTCTDEEEAIKSQNHNTLNPHDIPGSQKNGARTNSSSSETENGGLSHSRRQDTPPESPRVQPAFNPLRRDSSSFRKTYDENDKKRAIPCENCALTLPKKTNEEDVPKTKQDLNGPILRTRKPYQRVSKRHNDPSPPKSASSSDSESAITNKPPTHKRTGSKTLKRQGTASSSTSSISSTLSHDHYLDYTSTHEPLQPTSFSLVRQSCLRTLSCETLPPSSSSAGSAPTSPFPSNSSSSATTSSGGPIFFGDPLAGYTIAYIFRIPDPTARGRRRVYALMALTTHRERAAMKMFSHLSSTFKEIAAWIQLLAEAELDRSESSASLQSPGLGPINEQGQKYRGSNGNSGSTPTSAFLSGRSRGLDAKFANMSLRARGLAELVGLPDFFLELHIRFVRLLVELGMIIHA